MSKALLDIEQAIVWRGDTKVFDGLSLRIAQEQSVAILGPNGAGKSTLLKLMTREVKAQYRDPAAVQILGNGQWVLSELRDQIGIVSPDLESDYLGQVSGLEVVLTGFTQSVGLHGITRQPTAEQVGKAKALLARMGLAELQARPIRQMSTGQRRRIFLARALVTEPHTLILDEPAAGLDIAADFACQNDIRSLLRSGISVLLVTHHLHEIPPEIDRVILLKAGEVLADGTKAEVLTSATLSHLYDTDVQVHHADGFYFARPRLASE